MAVPLVSCAWLKPTELASVVANLNAAPPLRLISARSESSWLPRVDHLIRWAAGGGASLHDPRYIYLLTGSTELPRSLLLSLPWPVARRAPPTSLKGKDMFGAALRWSGRNAHLLPPPVLAMLPSKARVFLWWHERNDHADEQRGWLVAVPVPGFPREHEYPEPEDGAFSLYDRGAGTAPQLMLGLTPEGILILALKTVREACATIDLERARLTGVALRYVVGVEVRQKILSALRAPANGAVGVKAASLMAEMLVTEDGGPNKL